MRKRIRLAVGAAAISLAAGLHAQAYPERVVTIIVPSTAGGSLDFITRVAASKLSERLGQQFIVENVVGANGTIGTERVARSKSDGYTLLTAVDSQIILAKLVTPSTVRYDALKDLVPVSQIALTTMVLTARPGFPANSADEFARVARQSPGTINYASWGVGSTGHVVAEMINQRAQTSMFHVPYKGIAPIVTDLAAGRVDVAVLPAILASQAQKTAPVRIYGVTSAKRWPLMPAVPALAESPLFKGLEYDAWYGVFAPAGTDAAIVSRLNAEIREIVKDPTVEKRLIDHGVLPAGSVTPSQFAAALAQELDRTAAVVQKANIKNE